LPEIKSTQKAQYSLDSHLQESRPIKLEVGIEKLDIDYCQ